MPLVKIGGRLIYFAHVPKCAGTAVERYMIERFGPIAFHDPKFGTLDADTRWSATSPQHMPETTRQRVLPDTFLDATIATVRHPADRLRSVFLFQREVERRIPPQISFSGWIDTVLHQLSGDPHALDGHLRPMIETVPQDAVVFKVEDGLDSLVTWFDEQAGDTDGPRQIAPFNVLASRLTSQKRDVPVVSLTVNDYESVMQIYANDFERFGYAMHPDAPVEKI